MGTPHVPIAVAAAPWELPWIPPRSPGAPRGRRGEAGPAACRSVACPGNALAPFPESGAGCLFAAAPPRSGATVTGNGNAGGREAGGRLGMCL